MIIPFLICSKFEHVILHLKVALVFHCMYHYVKTILTIQLDSHNLLMCFQEYFEHYCCRFLFLLSDVTIASPR